MTHAPPGSEPFEPDEKDLKESTEALREHERSDEALREFMKSVSLP